jgi:hypothetical protein
MISVQKKREMPVGRAASGELRRLISKTIVSRLAATWSGDHAGIRATRKVQTLAGTAIVKYQLNAKCTANQEKIAEM